MSSGLVSKQVCWGASKDCPVIIFPDVESIVNARIESDVVNCVNHLGEAKDVLSSSSRSPMIIAELSTRHGTSGISIRAGPDHSYVVIGSRAKIAATIIISSRAAISSLSSTPAVRCTPLPHLHAHLTPYATIVMGANAMHHLPNKVRASHLNLGFFSATGLVDFR